MKLHNYRSSRTVVGFVKSNVFNNSKFKIRIKYFTFDGWLKLVSSRHTSPSSIFLRDIENKLMRRFLLRRSTPSLKIEYEIEALWSMGEVLIRTESTTSYCILTDMIDILQCFVKIKRYDADHYQYSYVPEISTLVLRMLFRSSQEILKRISPMRNIVPYNSDFVEKIEFLQFCFYELWMMYGSNFENDPRMPKCHRLFAKQLFKRIKAHLETMEFNCREFEFYQTIRQSRSFRTMERVPSLEAIVRPSETGENDVCVICQTFELTVTANFIILYCMHTMCEGCWTRYSKHKLLTCPTCRCHIHCTVTSSEYRRYKRISSELPQCFQTRGSQVLSN